MEAGSLSWTMGTRSTPARDREVAGALMEDIRELSGGLDKDFAAIAYPTFATGLASNQGEFGEEDEGIAVKALVVSHLPCVSAKAF